MSRTTKTTGWSGFVIGSVMLGSIPYQGYVASPKVCDVFSFTARELSAKPITISNALERVDLGLKVMGCTFGGK